MTNEDKTDAIRNTQSFYRRVIAAQGEVRPWAQCANCLHYKGLDPEPRMIAPFGLVHGWCTVPRISKSPVPTSPTNWCDRHTYAPGKKGEVEEAVVINDPVMEDVSREEGIGDMAEKGQDTGAVEMPKDSVSPNKYTREELELKAALYALAGICANPAFADVNTTLDTADIAVDQGKMFAEVWRRNH